VNSSELQKQPTGTTPRAGLLGTVVWIDRFGNAITDITRQDWREQLVNEHSTVQIGSIRVPGPVTTFVDGTTDRPFWYWGSGDTLEAALRDGNAAARYGWRRGLAVTRSAP